MSLFGVFNKVFLIENELVDKDNVFGEIYEVDYKTRKINRTDIVQRINEVTKNVQF